MKTSFDTNETLFRMLKGKTTNNGGVYIVERPDGSDLEDIVVNTIELSQEYYPQIGTSNINIHVADNDVNIAGKNQKKANFKRLKVLTDEVLQIVRNANIPGLKAVVEGQTNLKDQDVVGQHYSNIRIAWNIQA